MDNAEEILQALEEFSKLKPKDIPKELDEYLGYVAKTGDPVYQWHLVKHLFHEKLSNVIKEFYETSPTIDLPPCPNVDPFNYERLKTSLLERLDTFSSAPFTVQRICELLTNPRKQYNRVDKFMRAIEKNILVVSTREPGIGKRLDNDQTETVLNGMPDNRLNETDDRTNVCSDNLQFNSSTDTAPIPVENAANSCIIQEEIEIENTVSASTTVIASETKSWSEVNEKDSDLDIKTDLVDNSEINVDSTTSSPSSSNSELPKNTNILFSENEIKSETVDNVKVSDSICNEQIESSTPDSPDSPEPSSSENLCSVDNLTNESSTSCKTSEPDKISNVKENEEDTGEVGAEVVVKETDVVNDSKEVITHEPHVNETINTESSQLSEEINVQKSKLEEVNEETLKTEEVSPERNQPDSSNDSFESNSIDSKETNVDVHNENVLQNEDNLSSNSESLTSEQNISTEITDVTSSHGLASEDEISTGEAIVKEIEEDEENISAGDEMEDSEKVKEHKSATAEEEPENKVTNEETVASSDDCVSIREITEVKECVEETTSAESSVIVESSNEIINEVCDDQERKEGSIIHATPNISGPENESQTPTGMATVEDICVDQTSCSTEDEAMDVDESSNQQMITSEGENEGEPMDQSDVQLQS